MNNRLRVILAAAAAIILVFAATLLISNSNSKTLRVAIHADESQYAAISTVLESWIKDFPDNSINITYYASDEELLKGVGRNANKTDIIIIAAGHAFAQLSGNLQAINSSVISQMENLAYPPQAIAPFSSQEKVLAIPIAWVPNVMLLSKKTYSSGNLPESWPALLDTLREARKLPGQPLIAPGSSTGTLFDLMASIYLNRPADKLNELILLEPSEWQNQAAFSNAIKEMRSITDANIIPRVILEYKAQDTISRLINGQTGIVFGPASLSSYIPQEQATVISLSGIPLRSPQPPLTIGTLLGAGITGKGLRKDIARSLMAYLNTAPAQENIAMASSMQPSMFPVHQKAKFINENARRAARILLISQKIIPAGLYWAPANERQQIDELLKEMLTQR